MNAFILIILIGFEYGNGAVVIQQEFKAFEKCESARKFIVSDLAKSYKTIVRSQGCFQK